MLLSIILFDYTTSHLDITHDCNREMDKTAASYTIFFVQLHVVILSKNSKELIKSTDNSTYHRQTLR